MRLTKIVCTIGPSSNTPEKIVELAKNGMNVARINFSHGSQESHGATIRMIKEARAKNNLPIALLLDTKGAEIRTGEVEQPIVIAKGQEVVFASNDVPTNGLQLIRVNYPDFAKDVKKAETILLDNGSMGFDIVEIRDDGGVIGRSNDDGKIGSRRHINLPGADVSLPSMSEKDWSDLEFGIKEEMDFVALSFIRNAEEVDEVKEFLKKHKSTIRVITKVETRQAIADIDRIIDSSDGIMVARGDLGAEMPFEKIPAAQDMMVAKCRAKAKPVIVATHMLESMIVNPMPTRAEVTDIAHAATTRADATMLSGETAAGQHPILSIQAMHRILQETESHLAQEIIPPVIFPLGERGALAEAAFSMAISMNVSAILVLTRSGSTAQAVTALRPQIPVIALTETAETQRALLLCYGVQALVIDTFDKDPEATLERALDEAKKAGLIESGQKIVAISDTKTKKESARAVHLRTIA
jgi:pyruvate kinase